MRKVVALKKVKPLDGLVRERPAKRLDRASGPRGYHRSIKMAAFAGIVGFAVVWVLCSSPWPVTTTLRHFAAAPNCDFARLVGLAPARRGGPGYWPHLDRDGDGIACEPWPPRQGREVHRGEIQNPYVQTGGDEPRIGVLLALLLVVSIATVLLDWLSVKREARSRRCRLEEENWHYRNWR